MGILPFLLSAEDGVVSALVVRVGEMVMDKSAGFMFADELLPRQLFNV